MTSLVTLSPFLVFDFDNGYMSALHWACRRGNQDIVQVLLDHHANINAQDIIGRTPLFFAAKYKHIPVVR